MTKRPSWFQFPLPPPSFVRIYEGRLIVPTGFPRWSLCYRANCGTREPPGENRRKSRSSLFSVVFKLAGFIGFHTGTDRWFLVPQRSPKDLLGRDQYPSGRALRRSVPADVALSEKSPYLGGAQVRLSLWKDPGMSPNDSWVGTDLRAVRVCGGPCLRTRRFRRNRPTSEVLR